MGLPERDPCTYLSKKSSSNQSNSNQSYPSPPTTVLIAITFSAISYWLSNFRPTADAFFTWVMWVFLDLLAAESLVVLVTALFPSFVVSLALVAFANGLWMSVNGFMVQVRESSYHLAQYRVNEMENPPTCSPPPSTSFTNTFSTTGTTKSTFSRA